MDEQFFFKTHQKLLLKIANSEEGRFLLGYKGNSPIVKVTPESYHTPTGFGKRELKAVFFTDNRLGYKLGAPLHKLFLANESKEIENKRGAFLHYANLETNYAKYPQIYLLSSAFNPSTGERGGENASVPGFSACRDAATGNANNANPEIGSTRDNGVPSYWIYRMFQPFNTTGLLGGLVTAANWQGYRDDSLEYGGNGFQNGYSDNIYIIPQAMADPTAYANSDFGSITFSNKGSLALSSVGANGSYTNSGSGVPITDLSIVNSQGYSKLALVCGRDFLNSAPTSSAVSTFYNVQNRASAHPPILTVTYNSLGGGFLLLLD